MGGDHELARSALRRFDAVGVEGDDVVEQIELRKPTVAILYFDYTGKDDELAMLRKGLAQMLISDLSALDAVQLVERNRRCTLNVPGVELDVLRKQSQDTGKLKESARQFEALLIGQMLRSART